MERGWQSPATIITESASLTHTISPTPIYSSVSVQVCERVMDSEAKMSLSADQVHEQRTGCSAIRACDGSVVLVVVEWRLTGCVRSM